MAASIAELAIGWLAPPQCVACGAEGASLCEPCSTSEIMAFGERCWSCGRLSTRCRTCVHCRRPGTPRFVWITTDYAGMARGLIRVYKFAQRRVAANSVAELMAETLQSFNADADIQRLNYLIIPVPTATSRVRERGFDHAQLLSKNVAQFMGIECANHLGRLGQTRQLGARRAKRLIQPTGNYFVKKSELVIGRNILLIDDVLTTGATLRAATKVLRAAGAKHVDALVFAKRL